MALCLCEHLLTQPSTCHGGGGLFSSALAPQGGWRAPLGGPPVPISASLRPLSVFLHRSCPCKTQPHGSAPPALLQRSQGSARLRLLLAATPCLCPLPTGHPHLGTAEFAQAPHPAGVTFSTNVTNVLSLYFNHPALGSPLDLVLPYPNPISQHPSSDDPFLPSLLAPKIPSSHQDSWSIKPILSAY